MGLRHPVVLLHLPHQTHHSIHRTNTLLADWPKRRESPQESHGRNRVFEYICTYTYICVYVHMTICIGTQRLSGHFPHNWNSGRVNESLVDKIAHLCTYIYVYICTYIYVHIHMYTCICIYVYIYMYIRQYVCISKHRLPLDVAHPTTARANMKNGGKVKKILIDEIAHLSAYIHTHTIMCMGWLRWVGALKL